MFKKLLIFFLLLVAAYAAWLKFGAPYQPPGTYLHSGPAQRFTLAPPIEFKEHRIFPVAWYQVDAQVVAKKDYEDPLLPVDLGVVWGPLLEPSNLDGLHFRQKERFLYSSGSTNLDNRTFGRSMANMHLIPANDQVGALVDQLQEGDHVSLQGSLVQVFGPKGAMASSLTRNDSGAGACEVLYVTQAVLFDPERPGSALGAGRTPATPVDSAEPETVAPVGQTGFLARATYPREFILNRSIEIPVDEGLVSVPKGDRITLLQKTESQIKASYGQFVFWIESSALYGADSLTE